MTLKNFVNTTLMSTLIKFLILYFIRNIILAPVCNKYNSMMLSFAWSYISWSFLCIKAQGWKQWRRYCYSHLRQKQVEPFEGLFLEVTDAHPTEIEKLLKEVTNQYKTNLQLFSRSIGTIKLSLSMILQFPFLSYLLWREVAGVDGYTKSFLAGIDAC